LGWASPDIWLQFEPSKSIDIASESVSKLDTIVSKMDTPVIESIGATLWGKTRGAVLGLLLGRPDQEFHVRQIARLSGATLGPVQRELKLLGRVGILKRRDVGRQVFYSADPDSPVFEELRLLVLKTVGMGEVLKMALLPLANQIQSAFLFGSFARGRQHQGSDVDLMVVGDISVASLASALAEPQKRLGREINPNVYRPVEFAAKLRDGHHFLSAVLDGPKIFLIGGKDESAGQAKPSSQRIKKPRESPP
jgi:predicted nucleotidyltransferase